MAEEKIFYDETTERFFFAREQDLLRAQELVNKSLSEKKHLTFLDVIDILNSELPPDKQITPEPWVDEYDALSCLAKDERIDFQRVSEKTNNAAIRVEFTIE